MPNDDARQVGNLEQVVHVLRYRERDLPRPTLQWLQHRESRRERARQTNSRPRRARSAVQYDDFRPHRAVSPHLNRRELLHD